MSVNVTQGTGSASVAAEVIATQQYQQIKVVDGAASGTTGMKVLADGAILASIYGTIATSPSGNQSVSGTVGASVIGWVPIQPSNTSTIGIFQNSSILAVPVGSVVTVFQSSSVIGVVTGSVIAIPTGNQSVSGTVGASVIGWVPIQPSNTSVITVWQDSSVIARVTGSVTTIAQGSVITTNIGSVITVFQSSSLIAINAGSVVTIPGATSQIGIWQSPSIVGTYAEDAAHTTADKGLFVLGVRNDAVASFVSANLEYGPIGTDSAGRIVMKPFSPEESRIEGYHSVVSTSVTTLVAAAGTGLRNYVTDFFISNTGPTTTLITFKDGAGSILGYTIAPSGGGSNAAGMATPIRTGANATFDFQATNASSIIFATVKGFKAP